MPFNGYATPVATQAWQVPVPAKYSGNAPRVGVYSSHVPPGSTLVRTGYDVEWSGDGSVGRGQEPFQLRAEAEEYARNWNDQRVTSYLDVQRVPPELPLMAPLSEEVRKRYLSARETLRRALLG